MGNSSSSAQTPVKGPGTQARVCPLSGSIERETRQDKTMGCNPSIHTKGAEFPSKSEANTGLIVNSIAEIVCFSNLLFEGCPPTT